MRFISYYLILAFVLLLPQTVNCSDFRIFTDLKGRQMQAKIISAGPDIVSIKREDGLVTQVAINLFSEEDQQYIKEWASQNVLEKDAVSVIFDQKESDRSSSSSSGIRSERYQACYEITVRNQTYKDLEYLRIDYLIFKFDDATAGRERNSGDLERKEGSMVLKHLSARSEESVTTDSFRMLETSKEPGYNWGGSGAREVRYRKDRLDGIWVRIYRGNQLIFEESRPQSIARNQSW